MGDGNTISFSVEGPLFTPPTYGNIRAAHFLRGFNVLVRHLGGDYRKILEQHEIEVAAVDDYDYPLCANSANTVLEDCRRLLKDNLFGIHLAEHQDADVFGCLTSVVRAAPTLRAGIQTFAKFLPVFHSPGADPELVIAKDVAEFRWRQHAFGQDEQSTSHGLLLALKFLEGLVGHDFRPSYVMSVSDIWQHNLPEMERRFGCKIHRKASASGIAFPISLLDRPLKTSEPIVFELLSSYLSQVKSTSTSTIVDQVRAHIRWAFPPGNWTMDQCAAKLGMSARALQKRLHAAGVHFSDIVEEQRIKAAKHALLQDHCSLDEIAYHLGYSEQSSFGRAFKRWTKLTPQAFRDRQTAQ